MITLKDIEHDKFIWDKKYFNALKHFLASFKWDIDEIVWSRELMYKEGTDMDALDKKTLDRDLAHYYWAKYLFRVNFKVEWLLKEFYWEEDTYMMLPKIMKSSNVKQISSETILKYFIKELVKWWYLNDKYYLIVAPLIRAFPLWYNSKLWRVWFIEEDVKKITKGSYKLWNYTWRQWQLTAEWLISLEDLLSKEISLWYVNKNIWDPNRDLAYTHSLRQSAWYSMFEWSKKVLMSWNKINVVAASKGSGKSYFAAELCAAELFKEKKWFGWRKIRQIKYFVPDLNNVWSDVMNYMEWFLIEFTRKKIDWIPVIKINKSKHEITCSITNTVFKMISLHWYKEWNSTGEWLATDFWVIDEAAYVPDWFWAMFSQRALMEAESLFIITTISEHTPRDHWFYRLLIEWELGSDLISSHRVDILQKRELYELDYKYQTDVLTDEDHKTMNTKIDTIMNFTISNMRKAWLKEFYARAYCVILDERNVFNIIGNVMPHILMQWNESDYYVLAIDFWGNTDPAWVVLLNMTKRITTEIEELRWVPYLEQLQVWKKFKEQLKNLTIIWDATTIGKVIMQEDRKAESIVDYWVQFTWTWDWSWNQKGFYVSSKRHLVEMTALVLDKWVLNISSNHWALIDQLKNFVKITWTKSLVAKYQGKWSSHDDLVDSLLLCVFYIVTILWLTEAKDWEDYWTEFDNLKEQSYNEDNYSNSNHTYNNLSNVY